MAQRKSKRSRKGPKKVKRVQEAQESSSANRILEWNSKVPLPSTRPTRERRLPDRYGFPMSSPTPKAPKRRRTEEQAPQLPRITELQEQDAQTSRSRSKSPSRATDITDVGDLEKYDPPIYFKSTWEFEAAVQGGDKAISEELETLIQTTQIKRTATHSGVIPLALKVEFAFTHDHAILQLTW
jgi:hypothetical protein